jgi:hypothetical protein
VLEIVLPRLSLVALSVAQPFLINKAIAFLQSDEPINIGYGLIGGFAFVYIGAAVSRGGRRMKRGRLILGSDCNGMVSAPYIPPHDNDTWEFDFGNLSEDDVPKECQCE